jgi:hypothetical protein
MAFLSSLPSSAEETNKTEPRTRLSLAVARLDHIINRLNHLPHITHQVFPSAKEDKPLSQPPVFVTLPKEDKI